MQKSEIKIREEYGLNHSPGLHQSGGHSRCPFCHSCVYCVNMPSLGKLAFFVYFRLNFPQ
jgi:hypothetical protein